MRVDWKRRHQLRRIGPELRQRVDADRLLVLLCLLGLSAASVAGGVSIVWSESEAAAAPALRSTQFHNAEHAKPAPGERALHGAYGEREES